MEGLKKTWTHLGSFFTEWRVLENGKCVLESTWKVLEFFVQKRVRALVSRFLILRTGCLQF